MSLVAIGWAWQQDIDDPLAKLVLLYLADVAQENDDAELVAFPSNGRVSRFTAASESTVRRKIQALCKSGHVTKAVRRQRPNGSDTSNAYVLGCHRDGLSDTPGGVTGTPLASLERKTKEPSPAAPSKQQRDGVWDALVDVFSQPVTESDRRRFGKTVRELLTDTSLTPVQVAVAIPLRAARFRQTWPGLTLTLEALVKHWSSLAPKTTEQEPAEAELEDDGTGRATF